MEMTKDTAVRTKTKAQVGTFTALVFLPLAAHRLLERLSARWPMGLAGRIPLHLLSPLGMLAVAVLVERHIPSIPCTRERIPSHRARCIAAGMMLGGMAAAGNLLFMLASGDHASGRSILSIDNAASALILHVMVAAPIAEEFAFRGVIYKHLRQFLSPLLATAGSALLFSLMHSQWTQRIWALALGSLAAISYEMTLSLLTPILVHVLFNAVPIGLTLVRTHPGDVGPIWFALCLVAMTFTLAARNASQEVECRGSETPIVFIK